MKIPLYIQECFKAFDNINGNGIIEQEEIDALKGTGTIYEIHHSGQGESGVEAKRSNIQIQSVCVAHQ